MHQKCLSTLIDACYDSDDGGSADPGEPGNKKAPGLGPGASIRNDRGLLEPYATAFATTDLRHGLSTAIASSDARILAPAAMMNTRSQFPEDCCM